MGWGHYVGLLLAVVVLGAAWAVVTPDEAPSVESVQHLHSAQVSRASHAFCNCIAARAPLDQCLASAETGDGIGVTDQELLLATCLDRR